MKVIRTEFVCVVITATYWAGLAVLRAGLGMMKKVKKMCWQSGRKSIKHKSKPVFLLLYSLKREYTFISHLNDVIE